MRVLLVIDHFGSGGAQRQMVELACGLQRRGHRVEMFIYFPEHDFFRSRVDEHHIRVHEYRKGPGFSLGVVTKLVSLLRGGGFDVVVSYLSSANIYAELASMIPNSARLIVSERTSHKDDRSWLGACLRRLLHGVADAVVANSRTQHDWLRRKWWLREKVSCIYNGLDLDVFRPHEIIPAARRDLRLLAIGRIGPEKNLLNLIAALSLLHGESGYAPQVSWIGPRDDSPAGRAYCRQVDQLLESLPEIHRRWRWLGVRTDIPESLAQHHALIHPSLYEGLPNVLCEALAAGKPALVSNVCDHPWLVADGERGFLFDPLDPRSIASAIGRLAGLDADTWRAFSHNAREYAEANLGVEKMVAAYEALCVTLLQQSPP